MIDKKDRELIRILDINSRTTNSEISKRVGISKQLVAYRIEKLCDNGVIEKFYTIINGVKLGYLYFRVYLKFQGLTSETELQLTDAFVRCKFTTWVVKCRGSWNLVVSIYATDTDEFVRTYQEIVEPFQKNILAKKVVLVQNVLFSTRDYLSGSEGSVDSIYGGISEKQIIDKIDHLILKELSRNSRSKLIHLAKIADANVETVKAHIRNMEKSGIIRAHKLTLGYSKLGILFYIIPINLSNASEAARKKIQNYCKSHPNIVYLVNIIGDHDIDLEIEVENQSQLDSLIQDLTNKFHDIIRDVDPIQIVQQKKLDFYPF